MSLSHREMRDLYRRTVIVRKPRYGIIRGYHELPYVCLGESFKEGYRTTRVRGKVQVSPRFVIRPSHLEPSYGEIFGEENVDVELAGRIFGVVGFREKPVECTSEYLELKHLEKPIEEALSDNLNALDREEDITTGVIITPDSRYFPVSLERFIASIIDEEFRV